MVTEPGPRADGAVRELLELDLTERANGCTRPSHGASPGVGRRHVALPVNPCLDVADAELQVATNTDADRPAARLAPLVDRLDRHAAVLGDIATASPGQGLTRSSWGCPPAGPAADPCGGLAGEGVGLPSRDASRQNHRAALTPLMAAVWVGQHHTFLIERLTRGCGRAVLRRRPYAWWSSRSW